MSLSKQGYFSQANLKFSTAAAKNPVEPTYHREYAFNLVQEALSSTDESEQIRLASTAVVQAETAYRLNPVNSLTLKSLLRTYYGLAKIDPVFEKEVEEYAKRVTTLAPSEPKTFYDSALILSYLDKNKEAVSYAEKALLLKPDYIEAKELLLKLSQTDKTKKQ
jgi:tetratricopeptide (TPR) repeat protein